MERVVTLLAICTISHSLAITSQPVVEEFIPDIEEACSHELESNNAVTAWPGESW